MERVESFLSTRELLALATMNVRWRTVPRIARIAATFHSAICDDNTYLSAVAASGIVVGIPCAGYINISRASLDLLCIRCALYFDYSGDHAFADYLIEYLPSALARDNIKRALRIVRGIRVDEIDERDAMDAWDVDYNACSAYIRLASDVSRIALVAGGDIARHTAAVISADMRLGIDSRMSIMRELINQPAPCEATTNWLDCIIGREYEEADKIIALHLRPVKPIIGPEHEKMINVFRDTRVSSVARIGPRCARVLMESARNHKIAQQFAFDSPEFAQYAEQLDRRTRICRVKLTRDVVCAHLVASAKNPDARAFEFVLGKLRGLRIVDDAYEMIWNYGEGFAALQRAVLRWESAGIRAILDGILVADRVRLDLLGDDAARCVDFILARCADVKPKSHVGGCLNWKLEWCIARFGQPMIDVIRARIGDKVRALM